MSGIVGVAARRLKPRLATISGALASAAGVGLLALAAADHSLPIYLAATAIAGAGYSLLFFAGLAVINSFATPEHHGGIFAALYLLAYFSLGSVALALGAIARLVDLRLAIDIGAALIALMSLATLVYAVISSASKTGGGAAPTI